MNIIFSRKRRLWMVPKMNPDFTLYSELKATLKSKTNNFTLFQYVKITL